MTTTRETKEERETRILESLCSVCSAVTGQAWRIDRYPDRDRTGTSACDAILLRDEKEVAVEAEIVESFPGRKEDDARFLQVIHPAESALRSLFPDLDIMVAVPFKAVRTRLKWDKLARDFSVALVAAVDAIEDDFTGELKLAGIPFKIW